METNFDGSSDSSEDSTETIQPEVERQFAKFLKAPLDLDIKKLTFEKGRQSFKLIKQGIAEPNSDEFVAITPTDPLFIACYHHYIDDVFQKKVYMKCLLCAFKKYF